MPPRRPAARPAGPARPLRLLLAEDNAVNQRLAVSLLEKRGHQVVVVGNGREALAALDAAAVRRRPDGRADAGDGRVRGDRRDPRAARRATGVHTPIIAMTAHAMKGDRERCLAAGMDGYVSKPLRPQELFEVLERLARAPTAADPAAAESAGRARRPSTSPRPWTAWTGTWS